MTLLAFSEVEKKITGPRSLEGGVASETVYVFRHACNNEDSHSFAMRGSRSYFLQLCMVVDP